MSVDKKKKTKDPLKAKTEWTVSEFQMWLHGAYSLQGENWVPNAEQWEMILDIIYKLKTSAPAAPKRVVPAAPLIPPPGYGQAPAPMPAGGPMMDQMGGGDGANPPFTPDPLPAEAGMSLSALRKAHEQGALSSGKPAQKTANIDTSKGYTSSFD